MRRSMRKQKRGLDGPDERDTNRLVPAVLVILACALSWPLVSAQQLRGAGIESER